MSTIDPRLGHRLAATEVTVCGADGRPLAETEVTVEQTRHAFAFGNIGFDLVPLANGETDVEHESRRSYGGAALDRLGRLAEDWLELFNSATLPFYWGGFEPERGAPDTVRLQNAARWFAERRVALKGHPLVWHTVTAPWLLDLPLDEIEGLQRARIRREVGDFAGLIDTWDAINEVVIMPVFENGDNGITRLARDRGRLHMIRMAVEEARAANPDATLLLNDFDLTSAYECLIEGVLEAGIGIDAIGLQTHMHQGYKGEEKTLAMLDRFARYGLPLHLTESTLLSGELVPKGIGDLNDVRRPDWPSTPEGEERQADEIVRHYRTLVGHPAVEAVTYWGMSDDGSWLGAPVGLVRRDGSRKPSFDALHGLIKGEWWLAPTRMRTDAAGRLALRGFAGDYRVSAGGSPGDLVLARDTANATVTLAG